MAMFHLRTLGPVASAGWLLLAACSGDPAASTEAGAESSSGAPAPPLGGDGAGVEPPGSNLADNGAAVSSPASGTDGRGAAPALPAAPEQLGPDDVDSLDDVGSPEVDGTSEPAPTLDPEGLIRGADPTTESATSAGPFEVDTITQGLRDGPQYGTQTLHVPVGAEPPFASVVVVPGFVSPESSIRAWGPFLASHGIIALTIGTNGGGDPPEVRARALLDGIETLRAEHERADSPVQGQMALDRFGVMGWSMGGGGTLIAANGNPDLRAAVTFAAWSPGARFDEDQVPTLLLAGSADALAGGQSQGFFESIPESTPKMLFEVAGGSHSVANDPRSADGQIGRYGLSWLKVYLEGDERYMQFLLEEPTRASDFRDNL